mgnify:CR=1 FL=1
MQPNQASELKNLVEKREKRFLYKTRFIAITSGKGGVGKSSIAANLAYLLCKLGKKVAIFDADIGLANLDIMFGIRAKYNILHALKGEVGFKDIIFNVEKNLLLIPGDNGDEILKYANSGVFERFLNESGVCEDIDYMIIDTGAGLGGISQNFLDASDLLIVVTMNDPSAITDAYATIKLNAKEKSDIAIVLNMAQSASEANSVFSRMKSLAKSKIPGLTLHYLGFLAHSPLVINACRKREIFCKTQSLSAEKFQMDTILHNLIALESTLFTSQSTPKDAHKMEQNMLNSNNALACLFKRVAGYC